MSSEPENSNQQSTDSKQQKKEGRKKKSVKKDSNQEVDVLTADLQRLQADFVNFRNRSEEERTQAVGIGKESVLTELIDVLDNLGRAISFQPDDIKDHEWVKGVGGVAKQLLQKMSDLGLSPIETIGQEFNPDTMEAVSVEGEGEKEIVSEELRTGYMYNGRVLRAAMVKIERK